MDFVSMITPASANTSVSNTQFAKGWVNQPNGRGTWDIIQTCIVTLILCSWSSLVLNICSRKGRVSFLKNKLRWMLFTLFWPEITLGVAYEQWESASQCVEDFSKKNKQGYEKWTMRHAFFADMGGFLLKAPDFPAFPVDGQQLLYLVENDYIPYPNVDSGTIWDKNKADGFARAITLIQITWFSIQCIGRGVQHLTLSTLELLTINMIFCTVFTFHFWNHKPLDVQTPIILRTDTTIAEILVKAGDRAREPYKLTPLDFITAQPTAANFVAAWWWGLGLCFDGILFQINEKHRPVSTFSNSKAIPPRGYSFWSCFFRILISAGYFALHFAGWNFIFPTTIERKLWRAAMIYFMSLYFTYLVVFAVVTLLSGWIARKYFHKEASTFIEVASMFPRWFQLGALIPIYGSYGIVRIYIVFEGFFSLRMLPIDAYDSVNWSNFIVHF
ncbi:uncharacterized protein A1O5_06495 [Cladophialophora psammophila CBS 110553]|uniref:Uncharacterized protein n=1 Tax=Cladophialophora psammophila CBS 110553 TaxID=1182543 RepID=W9WQG6_9EURO|nr:uncharacterized protein A1O5_06495 [Cladophialophora psammophila CBS 110553]EXJ70427.1 hypothetical protein A1O5_06495 [Cladophialophora psammophila CBS 110553]